MLCCKHALGRDQQTQSQPLSQALARRDDPQNHTDSKFYTYFFSGHGLPKASAVFLEKASK